LNFAKAGVIVVSSSKLWLIISSNNFCHIRLIDSNAVVHPGACMRGGLEKTIIQGDDVVKSIGELLLQ
jgi:hypothetical protein